MFEEFPINSIAIKFSNNNEYIPWAWWMMRWEGIRGWGGKKLKNHKLRSWSLKCIYILAMHASLWSIIIENEELDRVVLSGIIKPASAAEVE